MLGDLLSRATKVSWNLKDRLDFLLKQVAEIIGREVAPGKGAVILFADGESNFGDLQSGLALKPSEGLTLYHATLRLRVAAIRKKTFD